MEWRMLDISTLIESGKTYVVRVEATVTDYFIEEPRHGSLLSLFLGSTK